jgi:hypothetical protein
MSEIEYFCDSEDISVESLSQSQVFSQSQYIPPARSQSNENSEEQVYLDGISE